MKQIIAFLIFLVFAKLPASANGPTLFKTEQEGVDHYCLKATNATYNDGNHYHKVYTSQEGRAFYFEPTPEGVKIFEIKSLC